MVDGGEKTADRLAAIQRASQQTAHGRATPVDQLPLGGREPSAALRIVANITLGSFVLLVLTGVHLFFFFRPVASLDNSPRLAGGNAGLSGLSELSRQLHVLSGWLVLAGVLVGLVAWLQTTMARRAAVIVAVAIAFVAATATAPRWSSISITANAGDIPVGIPGLFGEAVSAIAQDSRIVSARHLAVLAMLHIVITALACVLLVVVSKSRSAHE